MKEYFSIGEISELTGLSRHALRYYDRIHLVTPAVIHENGYRYYSFLQLFTLDWVRHLQLLGFSLDEIRDVLLDSSASTLAELLEKKKAEIEHSLYQLNVLRNTVDDYLKHFTQLDNRSFPHMPYVEMYPKRYALAEDFQPREELFGTAGYRLMIKKSRPENSDLYFFRRVGYLADINALQEGRFLPYSYYMFLEQKPDSPHDEIVEFPAGDYLCYQCCALSEKDSGLKRLGELIRGIPTDGPVLVNEYDYSIDDTISSYREFRFEIQICLTRQN